MLRKWWVNSNALPRKLEWTDGKKHQQQTKQRHQNTESLSSSHIYPVALRAEQIIKMHRVKTRQKTKSEKNHKRHGGAVLAEMVWNVYDFVRFLCIDKCAFNPNRNEKHESDLWWMATIPVCDAKKNVSFEILSDAEPTRGYETRMIRLDNKIIFGRQNFARAKLGKREARHRREDALDIGWSNLLIRISNRIFLRFRILVQKFINS